MAIEKYNGIIFKSLPYSETSFILDIYSYQNGLRSYIVSGVRKKKSKSNAGLYKPMSQINFLAYASSSDKLHRIKEAKYDQIYQKIPFDIRRSTMAIFMIDLCRNSIKEKEANEELYTFIIESFNLLDTRETIDPDGHLSFALHLTKYLGFLPQLNWNLSTPYFNLADGLFVDGSQQSNFTLNLKQSYYLYWLMSSDTSLEIPDKSLRKRMLDVIIKFYQLHVEGFSTLPSLEVCKTIFS